MTSLGAGSAGVPDRASAVLRHGAVQAFTCHLICMVLALPMVEQTVTSKHPLASVMRGGWSLATIRARLVAQDSAGWLSGRIILAMTLGVLFLLMIAWVVLKILRSRVISVDDVEHSTGLVVIGTVPRRVRGGSGPANGEQLLRPAADGFQRICRMLQHNGLGSGIRVVTVVPSSPRQKGPSFAADLARSLAHAGQDVVLVHANLRQSAPRPIREGSPKGFADLLQDDGSNPVSLLVSVSHHLLVLPPGMPRQDPALLLSRPKLGEVIKSLQHLGMIMVIDAPPASFAGDVLALAHEADATLLVVQVGSRWMEVEQAARTLRYGRAGDPAAVLAGVRRWASLAVGMSPKPGIDSGTAV